MLPDIDGDSRYSGFAIPNPDKEDLQSVTLITTTETAIPDKQDLQSVSLITTTEIL